MARLTLQEFRRQFASVFSRRDKLMIVYSGIWSFGHRMGLPIKDIPALLIEAMLEEMSDDQTLLLPSYTYAYARTREFSPSHSEPETGILPKTLLHSFAHVRTASALNSFLAVGPRAIELGGIRGDTIWGKGSLKHLFETERARMIVLGLPWKDACGFLHRIEEASLVPYRYFKTFHGVWNDRDGSSPWSETMYVRPLSLLPIFHWDRVDNLMRSRGEIVTSGGEIYLESADAGKIVEAGQEILASDKFALLENKEEVQHWVENNKDREVASLRRLEPHALDYHDSLMRR